MKIFGHEIKLIITKLPKAVEKTIEQIAEQIFSEIEYYSENGPYTNKKYFETNMEVFQEIKRLAREDYLDHIEPDELDEEELEKYHNPDTCFYSFEIVERKRNGNIVFTA